MPKMRLFKFWNEAGDEREKEEMSLKKAVKSVQGDFKDKFIKANVIGWQQLITAGSYGNAREKGLIKTEGKEYIVKEASINELPAIALEIIKMYNNGEGGQAANVLKRLSAEDKEKVIKTLNKELGIEKIASIDKQTWKEMFIEDDIDFKDELGNFDKVAFERMLTQMTPTEQALLVKFIEQQN